MFTVAMNEIAKNKLNFKPILKKYANINLWWKRSLHHLNSNDYFFLYFYVEESNFEMTYDGVEKVGYKYMCMYEYSVYGFFTCVYVLEP